jgi:ABC-type dipeptide/oligopeptide/nickel transport system permease component
MENRNMSLELSTWLYLLLMVISVVLGIWFAMRE